MIAGGGDRSQVEEISRRRRRAIAVELNAEFFKSFKLANFSATDTAAMESFDAETYSDHLCC